MSEDTRLTALAAENERLREALREIVASAEEQTTPYACLTAEQVAYYEGYDAGEASAADVARLALELAPTTKKEVENAR